MAHRRPSRQSQELGSGSNCRRPRREIRYWPTSLKTTLPASPGTPEPRLIGCSQPWLRPNSTGSTTRGAPASRKSAVSKVGGLYRRIRDGVQRAEVRFDGVAGCLRVPTGGSSREMIVIVDGAVVGSGSCRLARPPSWTIRRPSRRPSPAPNFFRSKLRAIIPLKTRTGRRYGVVRTN